MLQTSWYICIANVRVSGTLLPLIWEWEWMSRQQLPHSTSRPAVCVLTPAHLYLMLLWFHQLLFFSWLHFYSQSGETGFDLPTLSTKTLHSSRCICNANIRVSGTLLPLPCELTNFTEAGHKSGGLFDIRLEWWNAMCCKYYFVFWPLLCDVFLFKRANCKWRQTVPLSPCDPNIVLLNLTIQDPLFFCLCFRLWCAFVNI